MRKNSYTTAELVRVAGRDGNTKRPYLLVDPLQGKHVPVAPADSLAVFQALAKEVQKQIESDKKVLVIAFAETATAIGAGVADALDAEVWEMQTTREDVSGASYLFFSESHSHATEQRLVKDDLQELLKRIDVILFAEDEVTTGNTIRKLMEQLQTLCPVKKEQFKIASILNGMTPEIQAQFAEDGIDCIYLAKTDNAAYEKQLKQYALDGEYHPYQKEPHQGLQIKQMRQTLRVNLRCVQPRQKYQEALSVMKTQVATEFSEWLQEKKKTVKDILVLGTEECMYPPMCVANELQSHYPQADIFYHATTRSPISVSTEAEYPLHTRYELRSVYDKERVTYLYNLRKYDAVCIVTDADSTCNEGLQSIVAALQQAGNDLVFVAEWSD